MSLRNLDRHAGKLRERVEELEVPDAGSRGPLRAGPGLVHADRNPATYSGLAPGAHGAKFLLNRWGTMLRRSPYVIELLIGCTRRSSPSSTG